MLALLQDRKEEVTHLAVAFDNPIRSFRNDLFAGYKSDEGVPPEIAAQFDLVEEGVRALGVTVWSMDRWEADDALATAAARFRNEVEQVRILTPDKDLGQCLRGNRVVQVDRRREREIDEDTLRAEKGIVPESIPDWLALVGDDADGIPGLPGVGEKGASALLGCYRKLEATPADHASWKVKIRGADKLGATLAARSAEAKLYRTLATSWRMSPWTSPWRTWPGGAPPEDVHRLVREDGRVHVARSPPPLAGVIPTCSCPPACNRVLGSGKP